MYQGLVKRKGETTKMIVRSEVINGHYYVSCDKCGQMNGGDKTSPREAEDKIKYDGWVTLIDWRGKKHYCKECRKELGI